MVDSIRGFFVNKHQRVVDFFLCVVDLEDFNLPDFHLLIGGLELDYRHILNKNNKVIHKGK